MYPATLLVAFIGLLFEIGLVILLAFVLLGISNPPMGGGKIALYFFSVININPGILFLLGIASHCKHGPSDVRRSVCDILFHGCCRARRESPGASGQSNRQICRPCAVDQFRANMFRITLDCNHPNHRIDCKRCA